MLWSLPDSGYCSVPNISLDSGCCFPGADLFSRNLLDIGDDSALIQHIHEPAPTAALQASTLNPVLSPSLSDVNYTNLPPLGASDHSILMVHQGHEMLPPLK